MPSSGASLTARSCATGSTPDSVLALVVPWEAVKRDFTYPVEVIVTIPLDDQYPQPDQVARRFDGGDERIFSYDYWNGLLAAGAG